MTSKPTTEELTNPSSTKVLVNKLRPIEPIDWEPRDLVLPEGIKNVHGHPIRAEAAGALMRMFVAAKSAGLPFLITSGYRSYAYQQQLFNSYAEADGVDEAETYSARAGHSEHQTGLAVDLDDGSGFAFTSAFGRTPTGLWLREHCAEYGFILRYHEGEQPIVGYIYEPWHFRFVGKAIACDMRAQGFLNYEDYVGAEPAPTYSR